MKEDSYQPRIYRHWIEGKDLVAFSVTKKETDLYIRAAANLKQKAQRLVLKYRRQLEGYINLNPDFQTSLKPVRVPERAPAIIQQMAGAGLKAGVGPMAAVAGAIAEDVGRELLAFTPEIIVENGGDIFLRLRKGRVVGIYAGESPLTGKIGLEIDASETPLGVCTSSGTVGHSLSYGKADAVVVLASDTALADAAATAIGNRIKKRGDINRALEFAQGIGGLKGAVVIIGSRVGAWGDIKLCETNF
jgi:ApbE superfamily uncharacterized protein (UPF0280 family)